MGRPKKYESFDVAGLAPHVIQTTGGCWEWQGARNKDGYGAVGIRDGNQRVHRLSYEANIGPIGDMCVLHSCDNPPCCNPLHLFLGTHAENMADCVSKRRHGKLGKGVLEGFMDVIRAYRSAGMTHDAIGRMLGVNGSAIRHRLAVVASMKEPDDA